METSVRTENMRENVNRYPRVFPGGNWSSTVPMRKHLCRSEWTCVLQFFICIFANQSPGSTIQLGDGRTRCIVTEWAASIKFFNPVQSSWPWNTGILVGQKFIQNFLLMNIFANPILFSDPVFWTKPQEPHLFYSIKTQNRFWVATSSLLLPGVPLWSLWVLQEQSEFISRGAL